MESKEELEKEKLDKIETEEDILNKEEEEISARDKEGETARQEEIDELNNQILRLQADFVNYRKRVEKEKETIYSYAMEELMVQLLPVLDNFQRALDSEKEQDGFYEGVKMIFEQIIKVLGENGLVEIECLGENFDPNFHHAVFAEEVPDTDEGTILEVLQKGYLLNDKVIRPSMVKVAK